MVSRFCDISRSYKTFQNPNDESAPGPTTWKGRLMRVLTLPAFIPQRLRKAPGSVWRTISGGQKDMKLGKNFQPGEQPFIALLRSVRARPLQELCSAWGLSVGEESWE